MIDEQRRFLSASFCFISVALLWWMSHVPTSSMPLTPSMLAACASITSLSSGSL